MILNYSLRSALLWESVNNDLSMNLGGFNWKILFEVELRKTN